MNKFNWGIVGTGWIGNDMAKALIEEHGSIYGVCSGTLENALTFKEKYNVSYVFNNLDEMLEDTNIDIVYIATPHNMHYEMIKKALLKNKHVFCEKAITVNIDELIECVKLAKEKQLVLMDGVTLFHMPLYKKVKELINSGIIGTVKMVQVNFGSCKEYDINNRFFSRELAGGALLDIGVYATSFARFFMSRKPNTILSTAVTAPSGVDESSGILLKNDEDEVATISLTFRAKQPKKGLIAGELGYIEIDEFPRADCAKVTYTDTGKVEVINCGDSALALNYEIRDMENYVRNLSHDSNLQYIIDVPSSA